MTWTLNDDSAPLNPKSFRVGVAAFGFDLAGIAYCNRHLTDGVIPASDLGLIFPGTPHRMALALVEKLVAVGRWHREENGWRIHDFLDYQPSKSDVLSRRETMRAAKVAGGRARALTASRNGGRFLPAEEPAEHQQPAGNLLVPADQQATSPNPNPNPKRTTRVLTDSVGMPSNGHPDPPHQILEFLNTKTGRHYRPVKTNLALIAARLRDGITEVQLKAIILRKVAKWQGDPRMDEYLRPVTLFSRTNCEQYRGELP